MRWHRAHEALIAIAFFLLPVGLTACGLEEPCQPSTTCQLSKVKQYGIYPEQLVSSYEWEGDDLKQITTTEMNGTPGHGSVGHIGYDYDYMGRLEVERHDADLQTESGLYYNVHREIRYAHGPSSVFKEHRPVSASSYVSLKHGPLVLQQRASFDYLDGLLQSSTYHDVNGQYVLKLSYEYEGDCIVRVIGAAPDGARTLEEYEYDERPAAGLRSFGDSFYAMPSASSSGHCDRNLVKSSRRRLDVFERARDESDVQTYSYAYREDGLPSGMEYTLSGIHLGADLIYECALQ